MKTLRLIFTCLLIITVSSVSAQKGFGVEVGYSLSNSALMNLRYLISKDAFSVGATYQFSSNTGKLVKEQRSGYGQTITGTGDYYYSFDLGYDRLIGKKFTAGAELSFGSKVDYTNYADSRFSAGGYHMNTGKRFVFGAGVKAAWLFDETFGAFIGYNTLRSGSLGVRLTFLN